ncbi:hypothetical protein [Nocardiopsis sp. YSL2]|uniref:hypothetical protein n=1 Tax=Nocardiopsis sp. YSL2 TaxID=2939492 RepID=UPI0026F41E0C|nr:hypothetical protein [Nocardiopsis sp. YSL2]
MPAFHDDCAGSAEFIDAGAGGAAEPTGPEGVRWSVTYEVHGAGLSLLRHGAGARV